MSWIDRLESRPSAVTVGKFDGVHLGHVGVIETLHRLGRERGLETVVVTFDRNPLAVLRPDLAPPPIVSPAQKAELLLALGVDRVVTIPFDERTASMSPEEFVEDILIDRIGARLALVGADFRFGAKGAGDTDLLNAVAGRHGCDVYVIEDVHDPLGRRVSSTAIRAALADGRIRDAAEMLGHPPQLRGTVVTGHRRGRELGFPTANLSQESEGLIPADGVYAAWATVDAGTFMAAVSIGDNPTFDDVVHKTVEAFLLDVDLDLYERPMTLDLVERVRPMLRFDGLDELIARMHDDVDQVRQMLATAPH